MSNYPSGTASNVLTGPARMVVAVLGSPLPTLDGTQNPIVWDVSWKEVGYTEKGTVLAYTPTFKDIMVDEEDAPVDQILDGEKAIISAQLAENTLSNVARAVSASLVTNIAQDGTHAQMTIVDIGSGTPVKMMVGLEGLSPSGLQRIIIMYKAVAVSNISMTHQRSANTVIPCEFKGLADSTRAKGARLLKMADILAPHS